LSNLDNLAVEQVDLRSECFQILCHERLRSGFDRLSGPVLRCSRPAPADNPVCRDVVKVIDPAKRLASVRIGDVDLHEGPIDPLSAS